MATMPARASPSASNGAPVSSRQEGCLDRHGQVLMSVAAGQEPFRNGGCSKKRPLQLLLQEALRKRTHLSASLVRQGGKGRAAIISRISRIPRISRISGLSHRRKRRRVPEGKGRVIQPVLVECLRPEPLVTRQMHHVVYSLRARGHADIPFHGSNGSGRAITSFGTSRIR